MAMKNKLWFMFFLSTVLISIIFSIVAIADSPETHKSFELSPGWNYISVTRPMLEKSLTISDLSENCGDEGITRGWVYDDVEKKGIYVGGTTLFTVPEGTMEEDSLKGYMLGKALFLFLKANDPCDTPCGVDGCEGDDPVPDQGEVVVCEDPDENVVVTPLVNIKIAIECKFGTKICDVPIGGSIHAIKDVIDELDDSVYNFEAEIVSNEDIDEARLNEFDLVILGNSFEGDNDLSAFEEALGEWVNTKKGNILATAFVAMNMVNGGLLDDILPVDVGRVGSSFTKKDIKITIVDDITFNIDDFTFNVGEGSGRIESGLSNIGGVSVKTSSNTNILVKLLAHDNVGRQVYINLPYFANYNHENHGVFSKNLLDGTYPESKKLFLNSVYWAATGERREPYEPLPELTMTVIKGPGSMGKYGKYLSDEGTWIEEPRNNKFIWETNRLAECKTHPDYIPYEDMGDSASTSDGLTHTKEVEYRGRQEYYWGGHGEIEYIVCREGDRETRFTFMIDALRPEIIDLKVVPEEGEGGKYKMILTWTAPRDGTSGIRQYHVRVVKGGVIGNSNWYWNDAIKLEGEVYGDPPKPKVPGEEVVYTTKSAFAPGDRYFFAVRAEDNAGNLGSILKLYTETNTESNRFEVLAENVPVFDD